LEVILGDIKKPVLTPEAAQAILVPLAHASQVTPATAEQKKQFEQRGD